MNKMKMCWKTICVIFFNADILKKNLIFKKHLQIHVEKAKLEFKKEFSFHDYDRKYREGFVPKVKHLLKICLFPHLFPVFLSLFAEKQVTILRFNSEIFSQV